MLFEKKECNKLSLVSGLKDRSVNRGHLVYSLLFIFSSIFLEVLKIKRIRTAQKDAAMPIKATTLSPLNGFLKSSRVMLKIIRATANTTNTFVKIFIRSFIIGYNWFEPGRYFI